MAATRIRRVGLAEDRRVVVAAWFAIALTSLPAVVLVEITEPGSASIYGWVLARLADVTHVEWVVVPSAYERRWSVNTSK